MKLVTKFNRHVLQVATAAAVLLFSQQATAVGTPAGTDISNQASVGYSVGGIGQADILSTVVTFRVDNRINLSIVAQPNTPVVPTDVSPGDTDVVVAFLVTNLGNQTQDFSFVAANEPDLTDVDGFIDSADLTIASIVADNDDDTNPNDAENYIDSLDADESRLVWILADVDTPVTHDDIANMLMTATARVAGSAGVTPVVTSGSNTSTIEDTLVAVGGVLDEDSAAAQNTYRVVSAELDITKASLLIDDNISPGPPFFHVPGATVQYSITIDNISATTDATDLSVTDLLLDVAVADGATIDIVNSDTGASSCIAEIGADSNGDGCFLTDNPDADITTNDQLLTVDPTVPTGLDLVEFGDNVVVTFDTTIL